MAVQSQSSPPGGTRGTPISYSREQGQGAHTDPHGKLVKGQALHAEKPGPGPTPKQWKNKGK